MTSKIRKTLKEKQFSKRNVITPRKKVHSLPTLDKWILHSRNTTLEPKPEHFSNDNKAKGAENKVQVNKLKSSRSLKRQPSGSFQKYGVILPTFEEALMHKRQLEEMKKTIDDFDLSNDATEHFSLEVDEPKAVRILDCKHLSDAELERELELNYQYLHGIVRGITKSERHDKFVTAQYKSGKKTDDLVYNTSMILFTYEQKQLMLNYLSKNFGDDTQYFFKVLLPELCTKIFMDTYNMTYSEAMCYLELRPAKPLGSV